MQTSNQAAEDASSLPDNTIFCVLDGFKHGLTSQILNQFTDANGKASAEQTGQTLFIQSAEEAIVEKHELMRSPTLDVVELEHLISKDGLSCARTPRKYFKGTNISNCLGPLGIAEDPWKTTLGEQETYARQLSDRSQWQWPHTLGQHQGPSALGH